MTMTAQQVELVVARMFGYRQNLIVPNLAWSMISYEADMVVLRPSGWAIEIEIKVSASDIKRDLSKRHVHNARLFRQCMFAVPESLASNTHIPDYAGIISIPETRIRKLHPKIIRPGRINKNAVKWTPEQRIKLASIGAMRIWDLKSHLDRIREARKQ